VLDTDAPMMNSKEDEKEEKSEEQAEKMLVEEKIKEKEEPKKSEGCGVKKRKVVDELSKRTQKRVKQKKLDPRVLEIRRKFHQCCKNNDLHTAMESYHSAVSESIQIEPQTFYNLLNLCDGINEKGIHVGTPKRTEDKTNTTNVQLQKETTKLQQQQQQPVEAQVQVQPVDPETRRKFAFQIQDHMKQLKLPFNETSYTALIRIFSKARLLHDAENLLQEAESTQQCKPRLRMYTSLILAYCEMKDLSKAVKVWSRLDKQGLVLTEKEQLSLLTAAAQVGDANFFERILSDLAEDTLVPCRDTIQTITTWFQSDFANTNQSSLVSVTENIQLDIPKSDAPAMGPVMCSNKWTIDPLCTIQDGVLQTGCFKGTALKPVPLTSSASSQMMAYNESIVLQGMLKGDVSQYQGGGKGRKRKPKGNRKEQWDSFKQFLDKQYGHSGLNVVIDGANVGYYKQNFENAPRHVDYEKIDWVIRHFQEQGKTVLLVMHARHFAPNLMPRWAARIVQRWDRILYRAPPGMNDDWFWLHAALWGFDKSQTLVLTNDEMRDHHFQMLAPRSFLRWKERHQIHFGFGEWTTGTSPRRRKVSLEYPAKYSRRIQRLEDGIVVPLPKRGDVNRFLDGVHVADDESLPTDETYLCIRPERPHVKEEPSHNPTSENIV